MHGFNPWDLVKAFGSGVRWIFIGRRRRHEYSANVGGHDVKLIRNDTGHYGGGPELYQGSSGHGVSRKNGKPGRYSDPDDEKEELLTHAQSNPTQANNPDRIVATYGRLSYLVSRCLVTRAIFGFLLGPLGTQRREQRQIWPVSSLSTTPQNWTIQIREHRIATVIEKRRNQYCIADYYNQS